MNRQLPKSRYQNNAAFIKIISYYVFYNALIPTLRTKVLTRFRSNIVNSVTDSMVRSCKLLKRR